MIESPLERIVRYSFLDDKIPETFYNMNSKEEPCLNERQPAPERSRLLLNTETVDQVNPDDVMTRLHLIQQLRSLPEEAFSRMQFFQPQVGCFNRCAFCSQSAGADVWNMSERGLKNSFAALKAVASEIAERKGVNGALVGYEREHRPGIIFPYMDNDIMSYPHLDRFIQYAHEDLGARVRISTVGYSRHNERLQVMHERIAASMSHVFAGIRFSFTPYTHGWTTQAAESGKFDRDEFIQDIANTLRTYRPVIEKLGIGKETACVEIRFRPLVVSSTEQLIDTEIDGYHCIQAGPYLLIGQGKNEKPLLTKIIGVTNGVPEFDQMSMRYFLLASDKLIDRGDRMEVAKASIQSIKAGTLLPDTFGNDTCVNDIGVHLFSNREGPYYAVDPDFQSDGQFIAKHFYQKTEKRQKSGYTNSGRYFLNALLLYKKERGIGRREEFYDATWEDARQVVESLRQQAAELERTDYRTALHVRDEVLPIVEAYMTALQVAQYPAQYFFSRNFTVDTGQIVNQGRAITQFKGLAASQDLPITPREERGFGDISVSSQRGRVWRWSPSPYAMQDKTVSKSQAGRKNDEHSGPGIAVSELDTRNLMSITLEGERLQTFIIDGVDLEREELAKSSEKFLLPGVLYLAQN